MNDADIYALSQETQHKDGSIDVVAFARAVEQAATAQPAKEAVADTSADGVAVSWELRHLATFDPWTKCTQDVFNRCQSRTDMETRALCVVQPVTASEQDAKP